jgi:gluconokinase
VAAAVSIIAAMPDASSPAAAPPLHLVVMGVAGSGKSVVAQQISQRLALPLIDGDDFHPAADIEKMRAGERLTAQDRAAWLRRLAEELQSRPQGAVLSCPALRHEDRELLRAGARRLHFLHLALTPHQALERVSARTDHFYPPSLVAGDFEALEDPAREARVHVADATLHVERIVEAALRWLESAALAFTDA